MATDGTPRLWFEVDSDRDPIAGHMWNATTAAQASATLIIRGALDTVISHTTVTQLYDDLPTDDKALVTVPCASHFMVWEIPRHVLHELSADWLTEPPDGPRTS